MSTSVNPLLEEYAAHLSGKSDRTVDAYLRALRRFLAWLAERPGNESGFQAEQLTRTALEIYLAELRKDEYSISYQGQVKSAISSFSNWLSEGKGWLHRNPARGVRLPVEPLLAPRQLTGDQRFVLRQLVEKADDVRGSALFALGYWAGCRVSDVSWMRVANTHVNQKTGWIRVGYKEDKMRDIDLINAARSPLYTYLESEKRRDRVSEFVFVSQRSDHLSEAGIHYWLRRLKAKATKTEWELVHDVTFHDLRHDFAHRARQSGWSLEELAYYLGHTTRQGTPAIQTTVRYTQVSRSDVKRKLRLLEE